MDVRAGARPAPPAAHEPGRRRRAEGGVDGAAARPPERPRREVFGYLPYWALIERSLPDLDYDLVSTIAYFGVPARSDGTLQKTGNRTGPAGHRRHMTDVINAAHARASRSSSPSR